MKNYLPPLTVLCVWLLALRAAATTYYVDINSANPTLPYTSWSTAATDIQSAVNQTTNGDLILVNPGVYGSAGYMAPDGEITVVDVTNTITIQSVGGELETSINGSNAMRCIDLGGGAILTGFTVTNGATPASGIGGGINCETMECLVSNCVIAGNSATYSGGGANQGTFVQCLFSGNTSGDSGGGAEGCTLTDCVLTNNTTAVAVASEAKAPQGKISPLLISPGFGGGADNSMANGCVFSENAAGDNGGGAYNCTANNCIFFGNSAPVGGGASTCTLNNCTLVANSASQGGGAELSTVNNSIAYYNTNAPIFSTFNYCCTDLGPGGIGNITNDPAFVDWQNNDFHLTTDSPCINSGDNLYVTTTNDFDGNPRIVGGTVDIGAYEYQTPSSVLSYAWAQQYGLPTDGSVDYLDLDGTGMNNWQKSVAGLDPTDPTSVLVMLSPVAANNNTAGVTVTWDSVADRNYYLLRATNLAAQAAFWPIASNIMGQAGTTSYTDPCATNNGPYFYRVAVQ